VGRVGMMKGVGFAHLGASAGERSPVFKTSGFLELATDHNN